MHLSIDNIRPDIFCIAITTITEVANILTQIKTIAKGIDQMVIDMFLNYVFVGPILMIQVV